MSEYEVAVAQTKRSARLLKVLALISVLTFAGISSVNAADATKWSTGSVGGRTASASMEVSFTVVGWSNAKVGNSEVSFPSEASRPIVSAVMANNGAKVMQVEF